MPSQLASSLQVAKMSQAFAQFVPHFELVTSGDMRSLVSKTADRAFRQWYGLQSDFKITRLPILWRLPPVFKAEDYAPRGYIKVALAYCRWRSPQVVYTRTPYLVKLLLQGGLTVFWEYHEPLTPDTFDLSLLQHPNFLGMVTLAEELAAGYRAQGLDSKRILVAPSGVAMESFLPHQETTSARSQLDLPRDRTVIVYAGQLFDHKGIPTILAVAQQCPQYLFLLVGGNSADILRIQEQLNRDQIANVRLTGHVSQAQLPKYLYAADILLLPTSQNWSLASTTSPLKLFDYMTVKRPILASHLPNIARVIRHGKNGYLVEPDRPAAWVSAIAQLLTSPEQAQQMAAQAYQDVQAYTWAKRAENIVGFLDFCDRASRNKL